MWNAVRVALCAQLLEPLPLRLCKRSNRSGGRGEQVGLGHIVPDAQRLNVLDGLT